jgi:hypothetical protein
VNPSILVRSLEKQIIPCVQELRRILGTDENVLKAIKADYRVIVINYQLSQKLKLIGRFKFNYLIISLTLSLTCGFKLLFNR